MIFPKRALFRGLNGGAFFFLAALFFSGCRPGVSRPDSGVVEQGRYKNAYFHFTLQAPQGWEIQRSPPEVDLFLKYYLTLLAIKDGEDARRVHYLARMSSLPAPLMGTKDAVVTAAAAFIADKPGFDRARAVGLARQLLSSAKVPMKLEREFHAVRIGGLDFDAAQFEIALEKERFHEAVYVTIRHGHALVFGVIAKGEDGLKRADQALASARFDE